MWEVEVSVNILRQENEDLNKRGPANHNPRYRIPKFVFFFNRPFFSPTKKKRFYV